MTPAFLAAVSAAVSASIVQQQLPTPSYPDLRADLARALTTNAGLEADLQEAAETHQQLFQHCSDLDTALGHAQDAATLALAATSSVEERFAAYRHRHDQIDDLMATLDLASRAPLPDGDAEF